MSGTLERVSRDIRFAARTLRREPALVLGVVATFALAIGTNAAMFGLVTQLMLAAPPGIGDPDAVANVQQRVVEEDGTSFALTTTSFPTFRALESSKAAFAGVAATRPETLTTGRAPDVVQIGVLGATGDFFTVLRARPLLGRFFGPGDDELPSGNSVVVLSHAYWNRVFDGDRSVLGRQMLLDDQPYTVIGVAPRAFNGSELTPVDVFIPLAASLRKSGNDWPTNRFMNLVTIVARVRDGVTLASAGQIASAALRDETPTRRDARPVMVELLSVVPGRPARQSPQARIALWLAGVALMVLCIATANVGTLLSLRAAKRRREVAVRIAMGAGAGDLARQLIVESVMLATIGAAAGLLLSRWFAGVVRATLLPNLAATESFVDGRVLLASVAAAIVAGVVAGMAPLAQARATNLTAHLRSGGHGGSARLAFQRTLVTIQVGLCTVLLVGAGLFVRSLERVQSQDLGFSTASLLYVTLDVRGYITGAERDMAYREAVQRLRGVPAVDLVTVVAGIPFGPHNIPPVSVPGIPWPPSGVQPPIMYGATPEYLDMMGVRLVSGRLLAPRDTRGTPLVVLVNETMARSAWPDQSALGKCVRAGFGTWPPTGNGNPADGTTCREVVGVVRDSRARSLRADRTEAHLMQYYVPFEQIPAAPRPDMSQVMGLMLRVRGDVDRAAAQVQRTIQSTSGLSLFARVKRYQDLLDPQLRSWALGATLFTAFGALALGIAAVGMFGVISYVATQRTAEIGIRLALGGTGGRIARLVVGDAMRMVGIGVVAGVVAAVAGGPLVNGMLFDTSAREPTMLLAAAVVLLATTVVAAAWPAWRASRVPPAVALRAD